MMTIKNNLSLTLNSLLLNFFRNTPTRLIKRILGFLDQNPKLGDKWGYSIRQSHYYEPLPEFAKITQEEVTKRRVSPCINWDFDNQLEWVRRISKYSLEIQQLADDKNGLKFNFYNGMYVEVDAAVYYSLIREIKPKKVLEIGSGYSTIIAAKAIQKNRLEGKDGKIICIEPYPQPYLTASNLEIELITQKVETIDLELFKQLEAGDILFIDSTHTVKFGSDVCREILEILPEVSSGVLIHFHDIFFPYDYPPQWLIEERRAWNEQYMLEAFLAYNNDFQIVLANNLLAIDYPEEVAKIWSKVKDWKNSYHNCGSFWMLKK